ncbi:MAG: 6-phosphogluconolactonase [Robiginitalea sp.]
MEFHYFEDYPAMSEAAALVFTKATASRDTPVACLATGGSPLGMYRHLAASGADYSGLTIIKLDEWLGLPMDHPATCEYYLHREVLEPLGIPPERYVRFHSSPQDPDAEAARLNSELARIPPPDICVLGLGRNGHIGLNEPAPLLKPFCHRARLEESSRGHAMLRKERADATEGLTLGMADILKAARILLLVSGEEKKQAFERLCQPGVSNQLPASMLWLHPRVEVLVDCHSTGIPRPSMD